MSVRAKFRCLSVTKTWDGYGEVMFKPVMPKYDGAPGGAEENQAFWEASPSGTMEARYRQWAELPEPGSYWYVDMEPAEKGEWRLWEVACHGQNQMGIKFSLDWNKDRAMAKAELGIDILNKDAFHHFEGTSGTRWTVTIHPAAPPEKDPEIYP